MKWRMTFMDEEQVAHAIATWGLSVGPRSAGPFGGLVADVSGPVGAVLAALDDVMGPSMVVAVPPGVAGALHALVADACGALLVRQAQEAPVVLLRVWGAEAQEAVLAWLEASGGRPAVGEA